MKTKLVLVSFSALALTAGLGLLLAEQSSDLADRNTYPHERIGIGLPTEDDLRLRVTVAMVDLTAAPPTMSITGKNFGPTPRVFLGSAKRVGVSPWVTWAITEAVELTTSCFGSAIPGDFPS